MKILLIGNYENSAQESMQRFSALLQDSLDSAKHEVKLIKPPVLIGRLAKGAFGLAKWLGYVDRFILFPFYLRKFLKSVDVDIVHICDQANAVYIPHLKGVPTVVTCHDMFAIRAALDEIPESPTGWSGKILHKWVLKNLKKANFIICVSQQTLQECKRLTKTDYAKLAVVPNALNYPYTPMAGAEALDHIKTMKLDGCQPYFLHVGANQWYKNRPGAIRIFYKLRNYPEFRNHHLIMVGKPWTVEIRDLVKNLNLSRFVHEHIGATNEQLCALYSKAEMFLFPSLQEGFGWPIAEAQACGCPVVTTARQPMLEVGGSAAIYIDPEKECDAAKKIADSLNQLLQLKDSGIINSQRFSKEQMARGYLETYNTVLNHFP